MADVSLLIGNKKPLQIFRGTKEIREVYVGTTCVYPVQSLLASGNFEQLTWTLTNSGVLTVSGEGQMEYVFGSYYPWHDYKSVITQVVIEEGVESISMSAFYECENLTQVYIADSVWLIYNGAFDYCPSLKKIDIGSGADFLPPMCFQGTTAVNTLILRYDGVVMYEYGTVNQLGMTLPAEGCYVYVPAAYVQDYEADESWKEFTGIRAIEDYPEICG